MIRKTAAVFALACTALPALAYAEPAPATFVSDGVTYAYTTTVLSRNRKLLEGTADGVPFRLVATPTRVTGRYAWRPVEFPISAVRAEMKKRDRVATR